MLIGMEKELEATMRAHENNHSDNGHFMKFLEEQIQMRISEKRAGDLIKRLRLMRHWSWEIELIPRHRRPFYDRISFAVLFSFLLTFIIARSTAYAVTFRHIPNIFLDVRGTHIHHFVYGIVVLAVMGFLSLISFSPKNKLWLALGYGVGLGLAVDEAGQWLRLQDDYWVRQSYDALVIVVLALLFVIYLPRYMRLFQKPVADRSDEWRVAENNERDIDHVSQQ